MNLDSRFQTDILQIRISVLALMTNILTGLRIETRIQIIESLVLNSVKICS